MPQQQVIQSFYYFGYVAKKTKIKLLNKLPQYKLNFIAFCLLLSLLSLS